MNVETVIRVLKDGNYRVVSAYRYRNYAWRVKLSNSVAVFCGDKGDIWYKGKLKEEVKQYLDNRLPPMQNDKVFVVYGRDTDSRDALVHMLKEWGIEPLLFNELPFCGKTAIEHLEYYIPQANYGIVLLTPDDKGYLDVDNGEEKLRARQNVILEMGMLFSMLGRKRVAIVKKKSEDFELPSDISGMQFYEFLDSVNEIAEKLKKEINCQGYSIK